MYTETISITCLYLKLSTVNCLYMYVRPVPVCIFLCFSPLVREKLELELQAMNKICSAQGNVSVSELLQCTKSELGFTKSRVVLSLITDAHLFFHFVYLVHIYMIKLWVYLFTLWMIYIFSQTNEELDTTKGRQANTTAKSNEAVTKATTERGHIKNELDKVRNALYKIRLVCLVCVCLCGCMCVQVHVFYDINNVYGYSVLTRCVTMCMCICICTYIWV
jgi:hypothetical protein